MKAVQVHEILSSLRYRDPTKPTPEEIGFRRRFLKIWPDQEVNILSFQDDPNCKCSAKILQAVQADRDKLQAAVKTIYEDPEIFVVFPRSIVGEVRVVDDTDKAYEDMIDHAVKYGESFRGMFLRPIEGGKIKVYFY